jgi:hypothetical protein
MRKKTPFYVPIFLRRDTRLRRCKYPHETEGLTTGTAMIDQRYEAGNVALAATLHIDSAGILPSPDSLMRLQQGA